MLFDGVRDVDEVVQVVVGGVRVVSDPLDVAQHDEVLVVVRERLVWGD